MYCENCGTELKTADKFCEKCGNKNPKAINTEEKAEVNSKKDIKMKEMNVSKIKKYGVIAGIVVLLLLSFTIISKQVKKNSYIKAVQVMAPKRYPSVTFKEAFSNKDLFESSNWEYYVSKDKNDMVKFTGTIINGDNEKGIMEAYFWITGKNDISFHDCEFDMGDGADSNTKSVYGIYALEEVFNKAYESKNYVLPEELYIDTWSLEHLAFFEITERFAPVKYVKATSDMINKDIPTSATVVAETEPPTTVAVIETTPAETESVVVETESSNDDFKINSTTTVLSTIPAPTIYDIGSISPDDVVNAKFANNRSNSISIFYITKDLDGYRLYVEATTMDGMYCEKYTGYCDEIYKNDKYGLIFHFVSIPDSNSDYVDDGVYVGWYDDFASIDHPTLFGEDEYTDYLFNGEYSFEEDLAQ